MQRAWKNLARKDDSPISSPTGSWQVSFGFAAILGFYVYTAPTGPCAIMANPGCGGYPDILTLDSYKINSGTSTTLTIRNPGSHDVTLVSYKVQDESGHSFSSSGWTGPTIPVSTHLNVTFTIDGRDFTFQRGISYQVVVVTAPKNDLITFAITA